MTFPAQAWHNASIESDNNEAPDPGPEGRMTLDVALTDGRAFVSKSGNPVIVLGFKVVGGGQHEGHEWDELRGMKTDGQIKAAKATCAKLGVDVATVVSFEEIEQQLKGCVGTYYEIEVVQNGEWRNVYVQGRGGRTASDVPNDFPSAEEAAAAILAAKSGDDDIPF
jgi:hypothetical protein